jgi:cytochrome c-type biogenesis protein CcmE
MKRNMIFGTALVIACVVVAAVAIGGSTRKAVGFDEVAKMTDRCEVYGKLDYASIKQVRGYNMVEFKLVEDKTNEELKVLYHNDVVALPPNFPAASHARAMGYYDASQGRFVADSVLTKCPSKYEQEIELEPERMKKLAEWERSAAQPGTTAN